MALTQKLKQEKEVFINVRGINKYVVMEIEHYNRFREYELEIALKESKRDINIATTFIQNP